MPLELLLIHDSTTLFYTSTVLLDLLSSDVDMAQGSTTHQIIIISMPDCQSLLRLHLGFCQELSKHYDCSRDSNFSCIMICIFQDKIFRIISHEIRIGSRTRNS